MAFHPIPETIFLIIHRIISTGAVTDEKPELSLSMYLPFGVTPKKMLFDEDVDSIL
jgi:hypothetical protein